MSKQNRRWFAVGCIVLWILLAVSAVTFGREVVYVTREGQDLYKTNDRRMIETFACYVYAYGQKAVIKGSTLYFLDYNDEAEDSCTISKIYR